MYSEIAEYQIMRNIKSFEPYLSMLGLEISRKNGKQVFLFQKQIECIPIQLETLFIYQAIKYKIEGTNFEVSIGSNDHGEHAVFLKGPDGLVAIYQSKESILVDIKNQKYKHHYEFHPSYIRINRLHNRGNSTIAYMFGLEEFLYCGERLLYEHLIPCKDSSREMIMKKSALDASKVNIFEKYGNSSHRDMREISIDDYPNFLCEQLIADPIFAKEISLLQQTLPEFLPKMMEQFEQVAKVFEPESMKLLLENSKNN